MLQNHPPLPFDGDLTYRVSIASGLQDLRLGRQLMARLREARIAETVEDCASVVRRYRELAEESRDSGFDRLAREAVVDATRHAASIGSHTCLDETIDLGLRLRVLTPPDLSHAFLQVGRVREASSAVQGMPQTSLDEQYDRLQAELRLANDMHGTDALDFLIDRLRDAEREPENYPPLALSLSREYRRRGNLPGAVRFLETVEASLAGRLFEDPVLKLFACQVCIQGILIGRAEGAAGLSRQAAYLERYPVDAATSVEEMRRLQEVRDEIARRGAAD